MSIWYTYTILIWVGRGYTGRLTYYQYGLSLGNHPSVHACVRVSRHGRKVETSIWEILYTILSTFSYAYFSAVHFIHLHTATKWSIVWHCQSLHIQSLHWHKCVLVLCGPSACMCMCIWHPLQHYAPIMLCTVTCRLTCEYDGPDQLMMYKYASNQLTSFCK